MISWPAAYGIRCVKPSRAMVSPSRTNSAMASFKGSILANGGLLRRRHYYSVGRNSGLENAAPARHRNGFLLVSRAPRSDLGWWFILLARVMPACGNRLGVARSRCGVVFQNVLVRAVIPR